MHDLEDLFRQVDAAEGEILELEQALVQDTVGQHRRHAHRQ